MPGLVAHSGILLDTITFLSALTAADPSIPSTATIWGEGVTSRPISSLLAGHATPAPAPAPAPAHLPEYGGSLPRTSLTKSPPCPVVYGDSVGLHRHHLGVGGMRRGGGEEEKGRRGGGEEDRRRCLSLNHLGLHKVRPAYPDIRAWERLGLLPHLRSALKRREKEEVVDHWW